MAIAISSGFCAESTREIEEKTSQQNNTDYATAEHSSANEKSPGNEQKSQTQKKKSIFSWAYLSMRFAIETTL
jgi:hypothetical protein